MNAELTIAAAFLIGLLGSTHCAAMCGGISASLGTGGAAQGRLLRVGLYNLGRISSYALAGALVGALGFWLGEGLDLIGLGITLRLALGLLMVGVGLHLAFDWKGLRRIEVAGAWLWQLLSPLARRLLPARTPVHALGLGMLWGWLPCGLVYTTLVAATASGAALEGALVMLAFGAGTLPAMLALGAAGGRLAELSRRPALRRLAGASILLYGLWTLTTPLLHLQHAPTHPHPEPAAAHAHP